MTLQAVTDIDLISQYWFHVVHFTTVTDSSFSQ